MKITRPNLTVLQMLDNGLRMLQFPVSLLKEFSVDFHLCEHLKIIYEF